MSRRHNPLRVKLDMSYTAAEIAICLRVNIRTVRKWIANGLESIDDAVPRLFHGREIRAFLNRLNKPRQPLEPGEFYCLGCKGRVRAVRDEVWLTPRSATTADFTGQCNRCGTKVLCRVRLDQVEQRLGRAKLVHKDGTAHVSTDGDCPCAPLLEESRA